MLPHNVAFVALGTALLWSSWIGFNAGSSFDAGGIASQACVNTDVSRSLAMCTRLFLTWFGKGERSIVGALTGAIAGLICITLAAGFVPTWAALVFGVLAGVACYGARVIEQPMD
jgi:Amt family ammonium transporter